jgi:hypothetical protein
MISSLGACGGSDEDRWADEPEQDFTLGCEVHLETVELNL